MIKIKIMK